MRSFPEGGFIGKSVKAFKFVAQQHISTHAAHVSYFILLAVFPGLVLVLSLLRYTGLDIEALTDSLYGFVPTALIPTVERLIISAYNSTSSSTVSISAIVALWSASRGVYSLHTGLNTIYAVTEKRCYLYTRLMSVFYTFLFILVLLLTLVLHVFGQMLMGFIPHTDSPLIHFLTDILDLRFFLLLALQTLVFTAMFWFLPNRKGSLWSTLPGALLASSGWLIFSHLFSFYVQYFPAYAVIYGSVYAVALSMLWLYVCMYLVFLGATLNSYICHGL